MAMSSVLASKTLLLAIKAKLKLTVFGGSEPDQILYHGPPDGKYMLVRSSSMVIF